MKTDTPNTRAVSATYLPGTGSSCVATPLNQPPARDLAGMDLSRHTRFINDWAYAEPSATGQMETRQFGPSPLMP